MSVGNFAFHLLKNSIARIFILLLFMLFVPDGVWAAQEPNFVLILSDDQGWVWDFSCYESKEK